MARPLRIEFPGAWYHVMNRGSARQTIFHHSQQYQLFIDLLKEAHNRYQLEIHAYCLMSNHYHLFVRTPYSNLSRIMRHIDGVFTQKYNRINKTDGPLFRGRYKAILVDADEYQMQLSRYIHLNPVTAGLVQDPVAYPWSSYQGYMEIDKKPDWLTCCNTLSLFGTEDKIHNYKRFVAEGIDDDMNNYFNAIRKFPILGSKIFIRKIKDSYMKNVSEQEISQQSELIRYLLPTIDEVIYTVANYYNVSSFEIIINRNRKLGNLPRRVAIFLSFKILGYDQKAIALRFKGLSNTSISPICQRMGIQLKNNDNLRDDIEKIRRNLSFVRT